MDTFPFFDAGVIIILFTILVKLLMLPLSIKASKSQLQMRSTEKDIADIKEKYKEDKQEQSKKIFEYYKDKKINPFSGIFILLIQLPILIGLYQIFIKSGLPSVNIDILYSFVPNLTTIANSMMFLGAISISGKSLLLAVLAGVTTYFQIKISTPTPNKDVVKKGDMQSEMARAMAVQMKYVFPVIMVFISYTISAAIALYFVTSNLFAIGQEIYVKRKYHKNILVV
ncbi:MAG: YidC/Oxa1 family membrane protein insertase [Patescibacteria group bacterium]